jgi:hypothetical protein
MINILKNVYTLLIEIIGLVGGFLWARSTSWDYEPIILMAVSFVGILSYLIIVFSGKKRPYIDIELVRGSSYQNAPKHVKESPMKDGHFTDIQDNGTYLFEFRIQYKIIIRNNSNYIAFYPRIFLNTNKLAFSVLNNPLDSIDRGAPKELECEFELSKKMSLIESRTILKKSNPPDVIRDLIIIAVYQNEDREYFYTKFSFKKGNCYPKKLKVPKEYSELKKN